jgi:hypothetical protein
MTSKTSLGVLHQIRLERCGILFTTCDWNQNQHIEAVIEHTGS